MIRTTVLLSFLMLTNLMFGQSNIFRGKTVTLKENSTLTSTISKYEIYEIDATAVYTYLGSKESINSIKIELEGKNSFNLDLREYKIFKPGTLARVVTENGVEKGSLPDIKCYQGNVHESHKPVALTLGENFISGFITEGDHTLYIEPLSYFIPGAPVNQFIFYDPANYKETKEFKCLALETEHYKEMLEKKLKDKAGNAEFAPLGCKEVEVAEASDKSMCSHYGSIAAVQSRITSIINNVQSNYCCDFIDNLMLVISDWFNVSCTGSDPWTASTDAETLLNSFTNWAPGNFGSHDVGQLYTFRDFDAGTVGIAWVGAVCTSDQYNCIQDWTNNANLIRVTVAHEIGHNFNCDHDAPGSPYIMAPSVTSTNTWSAFSISTVNAFIPTLSCLSSCSGGTPPEPEFTSNIVEGCKPITVHFMDQSTGAPFSWQWSFPGGSPATSSAKNPIVTYNTAGTWDVTLTVTNSSGSNTITKDNYITVNDKPIANFTYFKDEGQVQFNNTTIDGISYAWTFGDGDFSNDEDPYHEYSAPGTYTVTLVATNDCGSNTKTQTITIVFAPLANFSSNVTTGCAPLTVNFSDESEFSPTSYLWTFPGGTPSSSIMQNPTVVYNNPGEFDVTLVATNSEGSNSITLPKYIKVKATPVASFTNVVNGYSVSFTNTTGGIGNTYLWNFGDSNTSTEVSPVHIYVQQGDYTVTLTVTNSCGSNTITKTITILAVPKAGFSSNVTSGCAALTVQFNDLSTNNPTSWKWIFPGATPSMATIKNPSVVYNATGQYNVTLIAFNAVGSDTIIKTNYINVITTPTSSFTDVINGNVVTFSNSSTYGTSYLWNFGDMNTSTQINPVHTYAQEGTYTVTLTVTNACGMNTITHTVEIVFPPTAGFSANVTSGCEPLTVTFSNTSSANAVFYNWTFPGGTPGTSTQKNPVVVYQNGGSYQVMLIAGNGVGQDTLMLNNFINVQSKPVASFSYSNNNGVTIFTNTTVGGTSYKWEFGDGDTSLLKNPVHTYESEGSFTVKLSATNVCGTTVEIKTIEVVFPPNANFNSNAHAGCNNLTVMFEDISGSGTTGWQWSFPGGNPSTSTLQNPVVNYNNPGSYDVTLIATNSGGSDTIVKQGYVLISTAPPVSNFDYSNFGLSYNFNNLSMDAGSYKWSFGDGGMSTEEDPDYTYQNGGSYTVQLIAFNGCGSDTFLLGVQVIGAPPAALFGSNVSSGCLPLVVHFEDKSVGGASSWSWSFEGGDPTSSTEQNPTVIYNTAGTYAVELIAGNSFGSDTITELSYIIVKGVPTSQFSYTLQGTLAKFTNMSTGGTSYLWAFGDGMTSTEANPNHSYGGAGKYTVTLTVTNECGSFSFTQTVDVKVGVNEIGFIESISIFPNPNTGVFNISMRSKQDAEIEVKILDMLGREIKTSNLEIREGNNVKEMRIEHTAAGQYYVVIKSESHLAVQKIIVE